MPAKTLEVEEAATEVVPTKKLNRHVVVALNHLRKRRAVLEEQDKAIQNQLEEIDQAIAALE